MRSTVLLGAVGVGGLGQELVVSLSSRNWDEVWTLIAAVIVLSALVDAWSGRLRSDMAVASWGSGAWRHDPPVEAPAEATLLQLDATKAMAAAARTLAPAVAWSANSNH